MESAIELLAKFQTGLVGLIGFTGVITTLIVNARLERRRLREAREHERNTLTRALLAELRSHHLSVEANDQQVRRADPTEYPTLILPAHNPTPVFDANIARLGLLSDKQIDPVLRAYLLIKEHDRKLELITVRTSDDHRSLAVEKHGHLLAGMLEGLLPELDAAIKALRGPSP